MRTRFLTKEIEVQAEEKTYKEYVDFTQKRIDYSTPGKVAQVLKYELSQFRKRGEQEGFIVFYTNKYVEWLSKTEFNRRFKLIPEKVIGYSRKPFLTRPLVIKAQDITYEDYINNHKGSDRVTNYELSQVEPFRKRYGKLIEHENGIKEWLITSQFQFIYQ